MKNRSTVFWCQLPVDPVTVDRFAVYGVGVRERMRPGIVSRPDGMRIGYLLMYFHDAAEIGCGGEAERFGPDHFVIWDPQRTQHYGDPARAWCHSWMICHGPLVRETLEANRVPLNRPLSLPGAELLEPCLRLTAQEAARPGPQDEEILGGVFAVWMRATARLLGRGGGRAEIPEVYRAARRNLDENFHLPVFVRALALRAHVSPPHFCREFRRYFGVSPLRYAISRRMQLAAYLVRDHNLRLREIARRVGCPDPHQFSKQFRKYHGVSPRQMRLRDWGAAD